MNTFNKSLDYVFLHCYTVTEELGYTITHHNLDEGIIRFKTQWSFWSYGEKFEIKLTKTDATNTKVEFFSVHSSAIQLIDFANTNNKNEKAFINLLKKHLEE
jgi:hypothetical protein